APAAPVASSPAPDASPARDPGAPAAAAPTASTAPAAPVPAAAGAAPRPEPKEFAAPSLPSTGPAAWPDFRGPNRDGVYTGGPIRTAWPSEGLRPLWRQPAGGGYASFVVARGKAFTIEQRREREVV